MKKTLLLFFVSTVALGSGYEKSVLWGGKYSGVGGSAAAGVSGSDSIFYNPAGLVNSGEFGDLTFNLTGGSSQFKGPIVPSANVIMPGAPPTTSAFTNVGKQESTKTTQTVIPGITYSMKLNESWSYGLGYYAVGGSRAVYEDVDFAPRNFKAKVGSEITITEFSAGVGYKMSDALRLGLGLRYTMTDAAFSSVGYITSGGNVGAITNVDIKDIKTANLDSVRLGLQYDVSEMTKIGLTVRTETKVSTKAKASGAVNACVAASPNPCAGAGTAAIAEADVDVETVLPMAVNLGVEHKLTDTWTLYGELVHTQYSRIEKVDLEGTLLGNPIPDIDQKWKDQLNVKLAAQWSGMAWPVRFGYVYTSEVSDKSYARASFTPPGVASTYTLGTGQEFKIGESPLDFNVALEYTNVKGDGDTSKQALYTPVGTYEASSTAIHTGFAYRF
ncbi:MAG: outer membrane protein transport protein [Bdellovibrionaceae bacterium]|nr:outer membrane protein transport protein [Pseudobdellovibrionaceae bacterium]